MYDQAYIDYLAHFHGTRDYFECHEILEERWKEDIPFDKNALWVGLIQLSVSLYHQRRGNFGGAARTAQKARQIITSKQNELNQLGLDKDEMLHLIQTLESKTKAQVPYSSVELPITDPTLLNAVKSRCESWGCRYGVPSNINDIELIHRHSMRDRSEVIKEREQELTKRKQDRSN